EVLWVNVRGQRYQPHERQALPDVLTPHSDVLVSLFGIDAQSLVGEFDKVLAKLTRGVMDAMNEMESLQHETLERLAANDGEPNAEPDSALDRVLSDPELATRYRKAYGQLFGLDLFDVELNTNIPRSLL